MICFVFPEGYVGQAYTLAFFYAYAPLLVPHIQTITYRELLTTKLKPKRWIFAGLDQADDVDRSIAKSHRHFKPINAEPLHRYELLRTLYTVGINRFDVHSSPRDYKGAFPVFARGRDTHDGPRTGLLHSQAALDALTWDSSLMLVEFCDTRSPDGLYRKYSVHRVGDHFFNRHMLVGEKWIVKFSDRTIEPLVEEEERFLASPVDPAIISAFRLAGIEHGRIDYGILDGKPQIWEINMNPEIVPKPIRLHERRRAMQRQVAHRICAAFAELAGVTGQPDA